MNKRKKGTEYEGKAAEFLVQQGYEILERNFYTGHGEIDLIAKDGDTMVFAEVKYRKNLKNGYPQEAVTFQKRQRIIQSAQYYLYKSGICDIPCRFDVIAIEGEKITHIKNAFELR